MGLEDLIYDFYRAELKLGALDTEIHGLAAQIRVAETEIAGLRKKAAGYQMN